MLKSEAEITDLINFILKLGECLDSKLHALELYFWIKKRNFKSMRGTPNLKKKIGHQRHQLWRFTVSQHQIHALQKKLK